MKFRKIVAKSYWYVVSVYNCICLVVCSLPLAATAAAVAGGFKEKFHRHLVITYSGESALFRGELQTLL